MRPHVAVIDPATRIPELDCFNRMSRVSRVALTYHLPALFGLDSLIRSGSSLLGVIVLGSGVSVNDKLAWQDALGAWITPHLQSGLPSLGLCYGHQLFAKLGGGAVGFLHDDRHKEKGRREIRLVGSRLWKDQTVPLVITHREAVTRVPEDYKVIAQGDVCPVEAMEHRSLPVWGFQAHPEATRGFLGNNDVPWPGSDADLSRGHALVDLFLEEVADRTG